MKGTESMPPKFLIRFFRWFCHPRLVDHIEGDLTEVYKKRLRKNGKRRADLRFFADVLALIRPEIIKPTNRLQNINQFDMFKNYWSIAWRNLLSNRFYSLLNLAGLTLGLVIGVLILLWIKNELSYDSFHGNADRIYRINVNLESSGNKFAVPVVQPTIAYYGLKQVPAIQEAMRITECNDYTVFRYHDTALKNNVAVYTDPSLFTMFDYRVLQGDRNNLFPVTESVILTETSAKRFFNDENPVGKELVADNKESFTVSAVIEDFPENSWLKCDLLFSTDLVRKHYRENGWSSFDEGSWGNYGWVTFLQLQEGTSLENVEKQLTDINVSHQPNLKPKDVGYYTLQALKDIHLYGPDGNPSGIRTVQIFSIVTVLILLIASINYVNLSTARALLRAREVSVRKIIGAARMQLFVQFVVQTLLFFIIALALTLGIISIAMPWYNDLTGKRLVFDLLDISVWKVIGLTLGVTLLASSMYPALLMSSFHPVKALKGQLIGDLKGAALRKVLVVGQFAFSVGLIVCTMIIGRQLNFMQKKELGYDKGHVLSMSMNDMREHYEAVKTALLAQDGIAGVTTGSANIVNVPGATLDVDWEGKDPNQTFFVHTSGVDRDFIPLFKMEFVAGQNFTGAATDSAHFILNETAVKDANIQDPIGKPFRLHRMKGTIIGVVKDFNFVSLHQRIEPFVFYYEEVSSRLFVKVTEGKTDQAIAATEKIWKQYNEGYPFDYGFLDETYGRLYENEQKVNKLFSLFTGVAIVISCLGLLGLSTYTAQLKTKEVGIRKVLGASTSQLSYLLSSELLKLALLAVVIATPTAWILMQRWLQEFNYKTDLPWWMFGIVGVSALLIALATVSVQSIKAALMNPIKSLRSE